MHILGLGFRHGVKVDTLSPAHALPEDLPRRGALVKIEDLNYSEAGLREAGVVPGTGSDSEVVVLNTAHAEFAAPDFAGWRALNVEMVLDGHNYWPQEKVEGNGLLYCLRRRLGDEYDHLHVRLHGFRGEGLLTLSESG